MKSYLVQIKTFEDDKEILISAFWIDSISEYLQSVILCKEYSIPLVVNQSDDTIKEKYHGMEFLVDSIEYQIGSKESIPCVKVYVI